jgi:hypothetical protein
MTVGQLRQCWGAVLRRQSASGGSDAFEIICCRCGDDPGLDYRQVSTRLRLVRGPYPLAVGVAAYEDHIEWHEQAAGETSSRPARPAPSHR